MTYMAGMESGATCVSPTGFLRTFRPFIGPFNPGGGEKATLESYGDPDACRPNL